MRLDKQAIENAMNAFSSTLGTKPMRYNLLCDSRSGYSDDWEYYESDDFRQLYRIAVQFGISEVRRYGKSRVIRIKNDSGESACVLFFGQRSSELGTDYAGVRVKGKHWPSRLVRVFSLSE